MDRDVILDLFAPVLPVTLRRMFGGYGLYADGLIFGIESDGEIYLKVDAQSRSFFEALGSSPFTYQKAKGQQAVMSYYRLPESAYDEQDLLRSCVEQAREASHRAPVLAKKPKKLPEKPEKATRRA